MESEAPPLTPEQAAKREVMLAVAAGLADTPLVLKGGSALVFACGLSRFSNDLDFDSSRRLNLEARIRAALPEGVEIVALDRVKDGDAMTRYRLGYRVSPSAKELRLKIEVSYRDPSQLAEARIVNRVRAYPPARLIEQKLAAMAGRCRSRDLYDLAFLSNKYPEAFGGAAVETLHRLTADPDALEAAYAVAFEEENFIAESGEECAVVVLRLLEGRDAVDRARGGSARA